MPGLDPFLLLGLATAGSGAVGWLLGPFVGNAVFGISHRKLGAQIAAVCQSTLSLLLSCSIFFSFWWEGRGREGGFNLKRVCADL